MTAADALKTLDQNAELALARGVEVQIGWLLVEAAFPQRQSRSQSLRAWAESKGVAVYPLGLLGRRLLLAKAQAPAPWTFQTTVDSYARLLRELPTRAGQSKDQTGWLLLLVWWVWMGIPVLAGWLCGLYVALVLPIELVVFLMKVFGKWPHDQ
jgi:hypothetical protein